MTTHCLLLLRCDGLRAGRALHQQKLHKGRVMGPGREGTHDKPIGEVHSSFQPRTCGKDHSERNARQEGTPGRAAVESILHAYSS